MHIPRSPEATVSALSRSPFRRKFKLSVTDRASVRELGMDQILAHAQQFVVQRLTPAFPDNDGKQTPFRGHPVFVAQHGTATCCRRCLERWHHIPAGRMLSDVEENYIVSVLECWLRAQSRTQRTSSNLPSASA